MPHRTIVLAPDSYKGSLSAAEVAEAMATGVRDAAHPDIEIVVCPLADGGEGTLQTFLDAGTVTERSALVHDAIGRRRTARYGVSPDGRTAIIEAAEANGLPSVADVPLAPLRADTFGVGELALDALDAGVDEIVLCIGGSATTDAGSGILRALGARFLDASGDDVGPGGEGLVNVTSIDTSGLHRRARLIDWRIVTDVDNPLCGDNGAAAVFGPQKGATPCDIQHLDSALLHLAGIICSTTGINVVSLRGGGAGGGIPATLHALVGAELVPGFDVVAEVTNLKTVLADASVVITGEGCLDSQSLHGKVVDGVVRYAPPECVVAVVAGTVRLSPSTATSAGISAAFSIAQGPARLDELLDNAFDLVRHATAHIIGLITSQWPPTDDTARIEAERRFE